MRKCIYKTWFYNKMGTIGMALFENEWKEREIRISKVEGRDEEEDTRFIDIWGSMVSPSDLIEMVELVEQFRWQRKKKEVR